MVGAMQLLSPFGDSKDRRKGLSTERCIPRSRGMLMTRRIAMWASGRFLVGCIGFVCAASLTGCPYLLPPPPATTPPEADFHVDAPTGFIPYTVQFINDSVDGTNPITVWRWDFGDGNTSEEESPAHVYGTVGTYTVSLRVASIDGADTAIRQDYIEVSLPVAPVATFSATPTSGPAPLTVAFTDTSTPNTAEISSWAWDFGDGATSTEQSPSHTYTALQTYTVSLTITTAHGTDDEIKENYIRAEASNLVYGGTLPDRAAAILQTDDGGFVMAGDTRSSGAGARDAYLLRTDDSGTELWNVTYGSAGEDYAAALVQTTDGGFVFAGSTQTEAGDENVFLVRTDSEGNMLWSRSLGSERDDFAMALAASAGTGFILAGATATEAGDLNLLLMKTDANGNEVWSNGYGGAGYEIGNSVIEDDDGNLVVAGTTGSLGAGGEDVYLLKAAPDGSLLWAQPFGGARDESGNALVQTLDGGYAVAGNTVNLTEEQLDVYVVKTGKDGAAVWTNAYGGAGEDTANALTELADGSLVLAGSTGSFGVTLLDIYLLKLDSAGVSLWESTDAEENPYPGHALGGASSDVANAIIQTLDGGFVTAGYTESAGAGSVDMNLVKVDAEGNEAALPIE